MLDNATNHWLLLYIWYIGQMYLFRIHYMNYCHKFGGTKLPRMSLFVALQLAITKELEHVASSMKMWFVKGELKTLTKSHWTHLGWTGVCSAHQALSLTSVSVLINVLWPIHASVFHNLTERPVNRMNTYEYGCKVGQIVYDYIKWVFPW